jgi:hypothetical protein
MALVVDYNHTSSLPYVLMTKKEALTLDSLGQKSDHSPQTLY